MGAFRWGVLVLLVLLSISLFAPQSAVQADYHAPLSVMELTPGVPSILEIVSVHVDAEADAVSALYINNRLVAKRFGSGEMTFMPEVNGMHRVRLVRKTGWDSIP